MYLKEFTIEETRGKKCIQYTDQQGGNRRYYSLKVIGRCQDGGHFYGEFKRLLGILLYVYFFLILVLQRAPEFVDVVHMNETIIYYFGASDLGKQRYSRKQDTMI